MTASQRRKFLPLVGLFVTVLGGCGGVGALGRGGEADTLVMADRGDAQAQYQLGKAYVSNGEEPRAVYRLCQSAVQGMVRAQVELAQLYERRGGESVQDDKDYLDDKSSAYFWYTAASSQGDGNALEARQRLEQSMTAAQIADAKQRATRWKQAVCVKP